MSEGSSGTRFLNVEGKWFHPSGMRMRTSGGTAPVSPDWDPGIWHQTRPAGLTAPDAWPGEVILRMQVFTNELDLLQQFNQQLLVKIEMLQEVIIQRPVKWTTEIYDLGSASFGLARPLMVVVEEYPESDVVGVAFPPTESYVEGTTLAEAMAALKEDIVSLYAELSQDDFESLGRLPRQWLQLLQGVIIEESADGALE